MFESFIATNASVTSSTSLRFLPNNICNLAFRNRLTVLRAFGFPTVHPSLHFGIDVEQIEQMLAILRSDVLEYYSTVLSDTCPYHNYLEERFSQLTRNVGGKDNLAKMVSADRFVPEALFVYLKRNHPKLLHGLGLKNSGARDNKRTRLSSLDPPNSVNLAWKAALFQKGLLNFVKFGQNDSKFG